MSKLNKCERHNFEYTPACHPSGVAMEKTLVSTTLSTTSSPLQKFNLRKPADDPKPALRSGLIMIAHLARWC